MLGVFRVDELLMPITGVRLAAGALLVEVHIMVTRANETRIRELVPETIVMLYGDDGSLVVRGMLDADQSSLNLLARVHEGDVIDFTYRLQVSDKLTDEARLVEL